MVRAIIKAHGGRCWVDSIPNQGATFYVALPRETGLALWQGSSSETSESSSAETPPQTLILDV